ncbi:dioxygenase [Corynebacterium pseudotuberculosis]|uniref:nitronate monooxygenase n=1 Tax=Corynebacterium pseudotuberculosis TaxID=1719 RepID=UPI0004D0B501|nr:nitronate monooxygenase [Corynebacterium pseudotuberculosis]AIG07081.1 dioxygenase [Corynebacterium pseudotuberculosis]AIG08336.1 dioxygenase [Corynebacterium pseudotuberculosis]
MTSRILEKLSRPIVGAPMAGGPSTPALAAAISKSGGLGFLASGNKDVALLEQDIRECAQLLRGEPYGVNFFYPQLHRTDPDAVKLLHRLLAKEYVKAGVPQPAIPVVDYSNDFLAKQDVVFAACKEGYGPKVVSSSFGCFTAEEIRKIHSVGAEAWASVTSLEETEVALSRGVDALIAQGHEAGGHRLTWDVCETPTPFSTAELCSMIHARHPDAVLIAAGGIRTARDVKVALSVGACAVSCGSAFLLSHEAGTSEANRAMIAAGGKTLSSRAFSGRIARGIATTFSLSHPDLPCSYPEFSAMVSPLRKIRGYEYCLVGERIELIRPGSAREILDYLEGKHVFPTAPCV